MNVQNTFQPLNPDCTFSTIWTLSVTGSNSILNQTMTAHFTPTISFVKRKSDTLLPNIFLYGLESLFLCSVPEYNRLSLMYRKPWNLKVYPIRKRYSV